MRRILILLTLMIACTGCLPEQKRLREETERLQQKCLLLEEILQVTTAKLQQRGTWFKAIKAEWPSSVGWCTTISLVLFMTGCVVGSGAKRSHIRRQRHDADARPADASPSVE